MKSLKERLDEKIRKESLKHSAEFVNASVLAKANSSIAFEKGAESLVPLIIELAEALKVAEGYMFMATQPDKGDLFGEFDDKNRKALQSIENFLGEK